MPELEETPDQISLILDCGEASSERRQLRKYLLTVSNVHSLTKEIQEKFGEVNASETGIARVALAYRMLAEINLEQASDNAEIANGIINGKIDPFETKFQDLLSDEDE